MADRASPRQNLLLLAVSSALAFLLAELVLRAFYPVPPSWKEPQIRHLQSPLLGWVLPPHAQGFTIDAPVTINSLGLRDDEIPLEKPEGEVRVLCLGDSFTFALGVRFEDLYVQKLEAMLNERSPDRRYQVINAGVAGYNTRQELIFLKARGLELDPDLVVLAFYWNDLLGNAEPLPDLETPPLIRSEPTPFERDRHWIPAPLRNLLRRSLVLYLGVTRTKLLIETLQGSESELHRVQRALLAGDEATLEPYWKATEERLLELADTAKGAGIDAILMIFPMESQLRGDYPETIFVSRLRSIWEPTGLPFLDLEPLYRRAIQEGANPFLPYDLHPGEHGMAIAAGALHEIISAKRLVRSLTVPRDDNR